MRRKRNASWSTNVRLNGREAPSKRKPRNENNSNGWRLSDKGRKNVQRLGTIRESWHRSRPSRNGG